MHLPDNQKYKYHKLNDLNFIYLDPKSIKRAIFVIRNLIFQ